MTKLLSSRSIKLGSDLIADGYELQPNENNRNTLVLVKGNITIKLLPTLKTKINANNRIARGFQAFKSAVTPSLAFAA